MAKFEKPALKDIEEFMSQEHMAIVGVSRNDKKFGNALVKELKAKDYKLYPVHPDLESVHGIQCYKSVAQLPENVTGVIICTKPEKTLELVEQVLEKGIMHIFLQQGAQNDEAIQLALDKGANIIHRKCALMFAEPVESIHKFHRGLSKFFGVYPK
jgi:predicted CoA-binding protein